MALIDLIIIVAHASAFRFPIPEHTLVNNF